MFGGPAAAQQAPSMPAFDSRFQWDIAGKDVSALELKDRAKELSYATFDSDTKWATALPAGFDPAITLEAGKNPGLGIRQLHSQGVDGRGIGIGIIDQRLDPEHQEFSDRLAFYADIGNFFWRSGIQMHGPAVASLAAGRSVGVAPGAKLYFVSTFLYRAECIEANRGLQGCPVTYEYYARALDLLVQLNKTLPPAGKIRVVSISRGFKAEDQGYAEMMAALKRAKQDGIFVLTTSLASPAEYGLAFHGLGRAADADPDDAQSYIPDLWEDEAVMFSSAPKLLVPIDNRTYASRRNRMAYEYGGTGGWSWAAPYLAGLYALAAQVKPDVTPDQFWQTALSTGDARKMTVGGRERLLRTIVNPRRLIDRLRVR